MHAMIFFFSLDINKLQSEDRTIQISFKIIGGDLSDCLLKDM